MWDADTVLLAEADPAAEAQAYLAFLRDRLTNPLYTVRTGSDVIAYLSRKGRFANRRRYPFPILLLLDLHIPRISGLTVLEWLERRTHLQALPVVVLTSSDEDPALKHAYELGADAHLTRRSIPEKLSCIVECFQDEWLLPYTILSSS